MSSAAIATKKEKVRRVRMTCKNLRAGMVACSRSRSAPILRMRMNRLALIVMALATFGGCRDAAAPVASRGEGADIRLAREAVTVSAKVAPGATLASIL